MKYTAMTIGAFTAVALMGSSALAADIYVEPAPVYEPVAAPVVNYFHGPYVGLHGGWGWADADSSYVDEFAFGQPTSICGDFEPFGCAVDLSPDGAFVGAQIGWNWVFPSGLMLGVEGDYSYGKIQDSENETFGPSGISGAGFEQSHVDFEVDQMATVLARVGWVWGRWMPFIAGGWGWAHGERDVNSSFPAQFSTSDDQWHDGWVAGGGLSYAINEHWSLTGEYRYFDGGEQTYGSGPAAFAGGTDVDLSIQTVRFRVDYNF
jgi:outer membrane immunogenic protein